MHRDDEHTLRQLAECRMAVRVDVEGAVLRDYHVSGGGTFRDTPYGVWEADGNHKTVLSNRFYLTDAIFHVALTYRESAIVDRLATAIQRPVYPLFLGRRSCPASEPLYVTHMDAEDPLAALKTVTVRTLSHTATPDSIRCVVDTDDADGRDVVDVPLRFSTTNRSYTVRRVRTIWLAATEFGGAS